MEFFKRIKCLNTKLKKKTDIYANTLSKFEYEKVANFHSFVLFR